jgi:molecular chaperone GrpE
MNGDENQASEPLTSCEAQGQPVTLSSAEYEELKTLARERDDYLKRLQRAVADYQNLLKRMDKLREMARYDLVRSLAEEVLPAADSLALALDAARQAQGDDNIVRGLELVEKDLNRAFERLGMQPVQAVGQTFDPRYHEAAMQEPTDAVPPNTVVRELRKGFMLGDRLLRPSRVVVAVAPQSQTPDQPASGC